MKKSQKILGLLFIAALFYGGYYVIGHFTIRLSKAPLIRETGAVPFLKLPPGFTASIFAENLGGSLVSRPGPNPGIRMMAVRGNMVLASVPSEGKIVSLSDTNNDGQADSVKVLVKGLTNPHGLALYQDWVYIAAENGVYRIKDANADGIGEQDTLEKLVDLPAGSHFTRTIKIFNDKMYVAIGSTCNVCQEKDQRRATIQECTLDGKDCELFAKGLRNTVDFMQAPDGTMYGTDNGRDELGNDIPPDEINILVKGKNYGWPFCYGQNIHDSVFDPSNAVSCAEPLETPSFINLPAHVAPLGITLYDGNTFPKEYRGKFFVAYHGSWNAKPPVGYKVVLVDPATKTITDFATGFLAENGTVYGRPVGITNFLGDLLISDDNAGRIYRISYK